ncbi:hypothetical protein U1Q18_006569 [Sarracenia purpurea var. burkii]
MSCNFDMHHCVRLCRKVAFFPVYDMIYTGAAHVDGLVIYGGFNTIAALKCKEWASTGFSLQADFAAAEGLEDFAAVLDFGLNWI